MNEDTDRDEEEHERGDDMSRIKKRHIGHALAVALALHSPVAKLCGVDNRFHFAIASVGCAVKDSESAAGIRTMVEGKLKCRETIDQRKAGRCTGGKWVMEERASE